MFIEPQRTPYDLHWEMFGIPVRVHPLFWLGAAILGWQFMNWGGVSYFLVWVGCLFVSVLVHELGHVLAMRTFGIRGQIVLTGFAGMAIPSGQSRHRWQRILISLAGPLAGFGFYGLVRGSEELHPWANTSDLMSLAYILLLGINLFLNILNLLPIFPLDGGRISLELNTLLSPRAGERICFGLSTIVAGVLAVHGFASYAGRPLLPFLPVGGIFMGMIFLFLAYEGFMRYQQVVQRDAHWDDRLPWER